jgi:hypothetical protein
MHQRATLPKPSNKYINKLIPTGNHHLNCHQYVIAAGRNAPESCNFVVKRDQRRGFFPSIPCQPVISRLPYKHM